MIKHAKRSILFILVSLAQPSLKADFWEWYKDRPDEKTFEAAAHIAKEEIKNQLQPDEQNPEIKEQINLLQPQKAAAISQHVAFQYLSKTQAKNLAKNVARDVALDLALELMLLNATLQIKKAEKEYCISISQKGLNIILSKVEKEAIASLKRHYKPSSALKEFTKSDYNQSTKMERLVAQELSQLPENLIIEKHFSEDDIVEVYPEGKLDEMRHKIESGTLKREIACSICLESFNKLGKRVNLDCGYYGHGNMCIKCALLNIHVAKDNQCPTCRAAFSRSDFSVKYLKENTNQFDLNLIKRLDPEALKKILKLFQQVS